MLKNVSISNFKSLLNVNVPLKPLTVLIGNNDTGKSSFLRALNLLGNGGQTVDDNDFFRKERSYRIQMEGVLSNGDRLKYGVLPVPARLPASLYQLPAQGVLMVSEGYDDRSGPKPLEPNGSGVPSLLDYLCAETDVDSTNYWKKSRAKCPD